MQKLDHPKTNRETQKGHRSGQASAVKYWGAVCASNDLIVETSSFVFNSLFVGEPQQLLERGLACSAHQI